MSSGPLVSVVIVSWNSRQLLQRCLASFRHWVQLPHEIIVVDNASTDQTPTMVEAEFPDVQLIVNRTNRGFAAANNQGFAIAAGQFIVCLNPDTELTEDLLTPLVDYAQTHPTVAFIGPEILNSDGSHQMSVRNFPGWGDQVITLLKLRHLLRQTPVMRRYLADPGAGQQTPIMVDQIMGACMLFPRWVLETLGDFDEGYWIWFEEVDWCQRAHRAGYGVVYLPTAHLVHWGGASFSQVLSLRKHVWLLRSLARYAKKYWSPLARWSLIALMPISYGLTIVQSLGKPR